MNAEFNDQVTIKLNDVYEKYRIVNFGPEGLYIQPLNSNDLSLIFQSPENWKVSGAEHIPYDIQFDRADQPYEFYAYTLAFGGSDIIDEISIEEINSLSDLYLQAKARQFDLNQSPAEISRLIDSQTPSINWEQQNILEFADLPANEKKMVLNYKSNDYQSMNLSLRYGSTEAPLNSVIQKFTPLDKDIVVYRIVNTTNYLPHKPGETSMIAGYLSTSVDPVDLIQTRYCGLIQKPKYLSTAILMKIQIPAGTQAIWLISETELLFPHGLSLELIDKSSLEWDCVNRRSKETITLEIPVWEFLLVN